VLLRQSLFPEKCFTVLGSPSNHNFPSAYYAKNIPLHQAGFNCIKILYRLQLLVLWLYTEDFSSQVHLASETLRIGLFTVNLRFRLWARTQDNGVAGIRKTW